MRSGPENAVAGVKATQVAVIEKVGVAEVAGDVEIADGAPGDDGADAAQLPAEGMGGDAEDIVREEDVAIEAIGGGGGGIAQLAAGGQVADDDADVTGDIQGGVRADGNSVDDAVVEPDDGVAAEDLDCLLYTSGE